MEKVSIPNPGLFKRTIALFFALFFLAAAAYASPAAESKGLAETGRDSGIFAPTEKIYGPNFTDNFILYIMDPDRLAGWSGRLMDHEKRYIPEQYQQLPVFGGWWGGGIPDRELLLREGVKRALITSPNPEIVDSRAADLEQLGIRILSLKAAELKDYITVLRDLGREMGIPERGEELARYGEDALAKVTAWTSGLSESEKPRVYIAHGPVGLATMQARDLLELAGGRNAIDFGGLQSWPTMTFEQVMELDPDVILVSNPDGARNVSADPKWKTLRAYKEGRLYIVPLGPFGWMHMPEVTRFIGAQWLAWKLHPDRCDLDIRAETKRFTDLFMHTNLTEAQIDDILSSGLSGNMVKEN
ncbi:ABC transporter substrate-binding protein [Treponema primitia]|uniref:ABC transporter substrate-binding protein n=1 Tax=Treponema primitia TaxID=88058 RepID=UPI0002555010|nr:ABC transporter substrate-binding protein [Treponema primitia]